MKYYYFIKGMTCSGCVGSVKASLEEMLPEANILLDFQESKVIVEGATQPNLEILNKGLPNKYTLEEISVNSSCNINVKVGSKLKALRPLFLIFGYLLIASFLMHFKNWNTEQFMLDFMGLFFIVFSFFKILDLNGFAKTFKMYDPFASKVKLYAFCYPFIEVVLGLMFLFRFEIKIAAFVTLFLLSITTIGVIKILLDKKEIQCACLGTVLKLKMTEATFIENAIMIGMATILVF